MWNQNELKDILRKKLGDDLFVVVSNREPYIHRWREGKLVVDKPASGLISAIDPMLKASNGIWIAHGSGNADRKASDKDGRVRVPPRKPSYTLRRVWFSKEEEQGYYYGFSNSVLWPLCHITFSRPEFDLNHWEMYKRVNRIFADAILDEIGDRKAFIWIQDFHLALLPAMIKERRPDVLVAHFWHIPWPNPEIFRICPWEQEILEGLLGNDLIGFHIGMHCDNFMASVDQCMEVRIDRERSTIFHHGGIGTKVKPFPISVDSEAISRDAEKDYSGNEIVREAIRALPKKHRYIALGVDRIDYTKGILERLNTVDRLLSKYPQMIGKLVFLQMGALSRIHIKLYKELNDNINKLVDEINWKYATDDWQPIVFLRRNLTYPEVLLFYRMADVCVVSSLHDGMNLVSKEFIASRNDEDGVLMLSEFTGAARELEGCAMIFNPYDIEKAADVLYASITMPRQQRRKRIKRAREIIFENNIYKWGSSFVSELADML